MASSAHQRLGLAPECAPAASHWEQNLELFRELYINQGLQLEKVKEIAEEVHGLPKAS